ncbi:cupin domain-containing protein [Silicimonas algicola]|uniref:(S)-ureidoglycine aminohydrolase cupin domain-containing protein n=1 Tax=Silicimonas algicola TaxID=1826607 RepID=A0A316G8M3_9RHOB|nr:cupin domain-containing protein [Silicimonas algicola]AZQ68853.1 cupin domain-containing protein [Silicimonas algicola]PWK56060.1 hypothetical protein C8D95_105125 [Silicimonas algicola]
MTHLLTMSLEGIVPEEGAPAPDRVLSGDPKFRTWNLEKRDGLYAGVWEATPGKWRILYDEWEYCRILEGRSVITSTDGISVDVGPGDGFILRPGFEGTWEVIETTRKEYVIRL